MEKIKQILNKELIKKISKIVLDVILYIFIILCVFAVIITISSKKDSDGTSEIFNTQIRIISSDSMEKCELTDVSKYKIKSLKLRTMIFIELVPEENEDKWYSELKVGDVLTFKYLYTEQVVITHRIISIEEKQTGGYIIKLEGDNKNSTTTTLTQTIDTSLETSPNYVIGKVVGKSYVLGLIISIIKEPVGIVCIVIIPSLIIIIFEIIKIITVINSDKKEKQLQKEKAKDEELEELRKKIAQLESQSKDEGKKEE